VRVETDGLVSRVGKVNCSSGDVTYPQVCGACAAKRLTSTTASACNGRLFRCWLETQNETYLSPIQDSPRPYPWLSRANEDPGGPKGAECASCQGAQAPGGLSGVKSAQPRLTLPQAARLRRAEEFRLALRSRRRNRGRWFTLLVVPNAQSRSRLGVVVARRVVAKAVHRNRLKRLVREAFRCTSPLLPALDLVVQVHAAPAPEGRSAALREELVRLLEWSRT